MQPASDATRTPISGAPIGWDGRTALEMLTESERLLTETNRYWGLETLQLREEDPIRYERLFAALRGGLVNARQTALNISASPIVQEIGELCYALYTPEGDSIALSTGIIVHVHTMSEVIKYMIRDRYEERPGIQPGDIFGNNNSMIGNVHTADVHTIVPIFWEDELVGWAAGVTHELDVGAVSPGSMAWGHEDRYGDGLLVSAEKIGQNDELHHDYLKRVADSVRAERYWLLDERTRLAGCHMVRDQVERVIAAEGLETYKQFTREVIEEGRRSFTERVREVTFPGKYESPAFMDVAWKDDPNVAKKAKKDVLMHAPLALDISTEGAFNLSLEGANAWGWHSFNSTPATMQGGMWVLLTQTLIPNDKVNDGAYLATSFDLPYGAWCNPDYEKVSTTFTWHFMTPSLVGLTRSMSRAYYARGYLEEISAGYPTVGNITMGGGPNHFGVESAYTSFEHSAQGTGAMFVKDGEGFTAAMWNPEGDMGEVESWERLEPLLYLGRSVKAMTAGAGRQRGGSGFESLRMVYRTPEQILFNGGQDGFVFMATGIFGGYPGNSGHRHNLHGTNVRELFEKREPYPTREGDPDDSDLERKVEADTVVFDRHGHVGPQQFHENDLYASIQHGGPGLGDVLDRDPEAVAEDLTNEELLPRFAESIYGVVAEPEPVPHREDRFVWKVDEEATAARRKQMRAERLEKAVPAKKFLEAERERIIERRMASAVVDMYRSSMELSPAWRAKFCSFWELEDDFEI